MKPRNTAPVVDVRNVWSTSRDALIAAAHAGSADVIECMDTMVAI